MVGLVVWRTEANRPAARRASTAFPWEISPPPRSLVPLDQITPGGPPPDGIPPIDRPKFESVRSARSWLSDREPVISLVMGTTARAYPLEILTWHEIVNDEVVGRPVTVTFCPLCNSAIAFDRRVGRRVLDFGTSGRLYRSNLVMYDRQTKSLWIQFTGQSVVGSFIGTKLEQLPVQIVSWKAFASAQPNGRVLSRDTGFSRPYGHNPYPGYDDIASSPFLFNGPSDRRLRPMERIVAVSLGDISRAYRLRDIRSRAGDGAAVISDHVGGRSVVILYSSGTASALDADDIARGRDIGATGVFDPVISGRHLSFVTRGSAFADQQTGSTWNVLGQAVDGPLKGSTLPAVAHDDTFWFVWSAFKPTTDIWRP